SAVGALATTEVTYRTGALVTTVQTVSMSTSSGSAGDGAAARRVYDHQQTLAPLDREPDPSVDADVEGLRTGAATLALPTDRYALVEAYGTTAPSSPGFGFANCDADHVEDGAEVGMHGPVWTVTGQPSNMGYTGWSTTTEAAAAASVGTLAETPLVCDPPQEPRAVEVISSASGNHTVDGHDLSWLRATVRPADGSLPVDLTVEVVRVAAGTTVHQYWFIGLDGDQPDLEAIAVAAAGRGSGPEAGGGS
ncbi:MAG: hypothetical protein ACK5PP_17920, partial [Acidimicrobiales bacterium]